MKKVTQVISIILSCIPLIWGIMFIGTKIHDQYWINLLSTISIWSSFLGLILAVLGMYLSFSEHLWISKNGKLDKISKQKEKELKKWREFL